MLPQAMRKTKESFGSILCQTTPKGNKKITAFVK
jgi:hypothetical protein